MAVKVDTLLHGFRMFCHADKPLQMPPVSTASLPGGALLAEGGFMQTRMCNRYFIPPGPERAYFTTAIRNSRE